MVGGGKDREEMRLIDAEKCPCIVCEDTRNAHCTYEHRSCEKFCNWLNNNAFDTEKVVEQLEEKTDFLKDCTKYGNKDAEQQEKSYSTMMMYEVTDLVEDLIDIVNKGGVE